MRQMIFGLSLAMAAGMAPSAMSTDMGDPSQHHPHAGHADHASMAAPSAPPAQDTRQLVRYPDALRIDTLANMRDHLRTLGQIQEALASGAFDQAGELAEQRLGMSSLDMHGAHEVSRYMPQGMQQAGSAMHRAASHMAVVLKDASVTGDLKLVLAAMAKLNDTCVACHAAYRLQ